MYIEVINLMLDSINSIGIKPVVLSIGNVAIFNSLIATENLSANQAETLRQIFVKRSAPDLDVFINNNTLNNADKFTQLMSLEGDALVLDKALEVFNDNAEAISAINDLITINNSLSSNAKVIYDLAEIKAYGYHTGVIFSAYNENYSKALAQGGRYNNIGKSFGKSRAATGFSFDLKFLSQTN